jgi:hypothetical protein
MRGSVPAFLVLYGVSLSVRSLAGPMPACVAAALSADQHVLLTNDFSSDNADETHVRKVTGSVFVYFKNSTSPMPGRVSLALTLIGVLDRYGACAFL